MSLCFSFPSAKLSVREPSGEELVTPFAPLFLLRVKGRVRRLGMPIGDVAGQPALIEGGFQGISVCLCPWAPTSLTTIPFVER